MNCITHHNKKILLTALGILMLIAGACSMPNTQSAVNEVWEEALLNNFETLFVDGPIEITFLQGDHNNAHKTAGVLMSQEEGSLNLSGSGKINLTLTSLDSLSAAVSNGASIDFAGLVPESLLLNVTDSRVISTFEETTSLYNITLRATRSYIHFYRAPFTELNLFTLTDKSILTTEIADEAAINKEVVIDGTSTFNYYSSSFIKDKIDGDFDAASLSRTQYRGEGHPPRP